MPAICSRRPTLDAGLNALQSAEFIYEANLFPVLEYTFKHALTHEVAYGSLLQERRRVLHASIVDAIETLHPDRSAEHSERLASSRAARGALGQGRSRTRARRRSKAWPARPIAKPSAFFEQALAALEHLPQTMPRWSRRSMCGSTCGRRSSPLGEFQQVLATCSRRRPSPRPSATSSGWRASLPWLAYSYFFTLGDYGRSIATGERALPSVARWPTSPSRSSPRSISPIRISSAVTIGRAVEHLKWIAATLKGDMVRERFGMAAYPAVLARGLLAWCLGDLGEFAEGTTYAEEALDLAAALDQPWSQGVAQTYLGHFYLGQGQTRAAISILERCDALAKRWDLPRLVSFSASLLGAAYAMAGRHAESMPLLDRAAAQIATGEGGSESRLAIPLAEVLDSRRPAGCGDAARATGTCRIAPAQRKGLRSAGAAAPR